MTNNYMPLEFNDKNEIKEMLEKNLKMTEEIYAMTKKIKSYLNFQKIMSLFYFLIIVIPIILSIIYLPPLLKGVFSQYQELLGGTPNFSFENLLKGGSGQVDLKNISPELLNAIKEKK